MHLYVGIQTPCCCALAVSVYKQFPLDRFRRWSCHLVCVVFLVLFLEILLCVRVFVVSVDLCVLFFVCVGSFLFALLCAILSCLYFSVFFC